MLTRIHIKNFRSFSDVEIGPFKRINLITGLNNSGKTGLLEAIFLVLRRDDLPGTPQPRNQAANLPNLFRVFSPQADAGENFWLWLFRDKDREKTIEISVCTDAGVEERVWLTARHPNQFDEVKSGLFKHTGNLGNIHVLRPSSSIKLPAPAIFSSHPSDPVQDAIDYNRVILKRGKRKVETLLKQIDERVTAVEALQTGQRPLIYADIGLPEMIPVSHLGEGFCRLLDIYSELLAGEAKVLLIDEIENGLHHTVLPVVWKGLIAAAKELNVQIFATTHSAECIFAADQAARDSEPYELNLVRLDRVDGEIKATIVEQKDLETAKEFNWELR
jgi:predicted ATPase